MISLQAKPSSQAVQLACLTFWSVLCLLGLALARRPAQQLGAVRPDPRERALTPEDAMYSFPCGSRVIRLFADADEDGIPDLAIQRWDPIERRTHIDLISGRSGELIRVLWKGSGDPLRALTWEVGGDVDGDRVPDLLVGMPEDGPGRLLVLSGRTGEVKLELAGTETGERLGTSVAFLGDVDGDGCDDFAFAATELPILWPSECREVAKGASYLSSSNSSGTKHYIVFKDGTRVEHRGYQQECMRKRSTQAGYVSARSGRGGGELWRCAGSMPGHAFGTLVHPLGDLDGDGIADLSAQSDFRSTQPIRLLSGKTGALIREVITRFGPAGPAGDVDGDGTPDLLLDAHDVDSADRVGGVQIVSGRSGEALYTLPYPDMMSECGVSCPMGDMDGDGHADIALGDANFHIKGPGDPDFEAGDFVPDLRNMPLAQALKIESDPWCAFTWESGAALVYSGKTCRPMLGVWGPPGSRLGLGLCVLPMPDVSGDGYPDLLVTDEDTAYVFAGPGPEAK